MNPVTMRFNLKATVCFVRIGRLSARAEGTYHRSR